MYRASMKKDINNLKNKIGIKVQATQGDQKVMELVFQKHQIVNKNMLISIFPKHILILQWLT
jgi:hypothetical protein